MENVRTDFDDSCEHYLFDRKEFTAFHLKRLEKKSESGNYGQIRPLHPYSGKWLAAYTPLPEKLVVKNHEDLNFYKAAIFLFVFAGTYPLLYLLSEKDHKSPFVLILSVVFYTIAGFLIRSLIKLKKQQSQLPTALVLSRQGILIKRQLYPWANSAFFIRVSGSKTEIFYLEICTHGFYQTSVPLNGLSLSHQQIESLIIHYSREQEENGILPSKTKHVFYT